MITRNTVKIRMATLASALVLMVASAAGASPPHGKQWESVGPLFWEAEHEESAGGAIEEGRGGDGGVGSGAWVRRHSNSIDGRVIATELEPGHVYTVNIVVFNNPDACTSPTSAPLRCGLMDFFFNPAAEGAIMWGDGALARNPTVEFRMHRKVKTKSRVWLGSPAGLTNPAGAEITFDLLDMGLPIPDHLRDQRTSATFGCGTGEPNDAHSGGFCKDIAGNGM